MVLWSLSRPSGLIPKKKKKNVIFLIGNWNAKVRSKEIPGVIGKFGLGVKYKVGQSLTVFKGS